MYCQMEKGRLTAAGWSDENILGMASVWTRMDFFFFLVYMWLPAPVDESASPIWERVRRTSTVCNTPVMIKYLVQSHWKKNVQTIPLV